MNHTGNVLANELRHWSIKDVIDFGVWAVVQILESKTPRKLNLPRKQKTKLLIGLKNLTTSSRTDIDILCNYANGIYHSKDSNIADAAYYIIGTYNNYLDDLEITKEDCNYICNEISIIVDISDTLVDLIYNKVISLSEADLLSSYLSDVLLGQNESDISLSKEGDKNEEEQKQQGVLNQNRVTRPSNRKSQTFKGTSKKRRRPKGN